MILKIKADLAYEDKQTKIDFPGAILNFEHAVKMAASSHQVWAYPSRRSICAPPHSTLCCTSNRDIPLDFNHTRSSIK